MVHTILTAAEAETEDVPLAIEPTVVATAMLTSNDVLAGAGVDGAAVPAVGSTADGIPETTPASELGNAEMTEQENEAADERVFVQHALSQPTAAAAAGVDGVNSDIEDDAEDIEPSGFM
jgi:hypothetical protein